MSFALVDRRWEYLGHWNPFAGRTMRTSASSMRPGSDMLGKAVSTLGLGWPMMQPMKDCPGCSQWLGDDCPSGGRSARTSSAAAAEIIRARFHR